MVGKRSAWGGGLLLAAVAGTPIAWSASPPVVTPRVDAGATPVEQRMVFLLERVEQLERELRQLRGDAEQTNHQLEEVKRRQRELYLDVDRRLRELELGASNRTTQSSTPATPPAAGASASTPAAGSAPQAASAAPSADERAAYEGAFTLLKEGRYPQSIEALQKFLKAYPQSGYADNAQYWLGEANYVSREYKTAAAEFEKVVSQYPNSSKVPDAMLKLGFTRYELQQWGEARKALEQVVSQFPNSTAARLAETRLQRMRKEGH